MGNGITKRHVVLALVAVLCVAVLILLRPTVAVSEEVLVWDMDTLVSAHSLVDW